MIISTWYGLVSSGSDGDLPLIVLACGVRSYFSGVWFCIETSGVREGEAAVLDTGSESCCGFSNHFCRVPDWFIHSPGRYGWRQFLVLPVVIIYQFYRTKKFQIKPMVLIGAILLLISFATNLPSVIEKRLFLENDLHQIQNINARLVLYQLFWEKWKVRPWLGYGPGTTELLIKQTGDKYATVAMLDHFHNFVLDILIQIGISGLLFYCSSFFIVIRQLFRSKKHGYIDSNYFLFGIVGLSLMMICGLSGQPFSDYKGVFLFGFLGGICYQSKFFESSHRRHSGELN